MDGLMETGKENKKREEVMEKDIVNSERGELVVRMEDIAIDTLQQIAGGDEGKLHEFARAIAGHGMVSQFDFDLVQKSLHDAVDRLEQSYTNLRETAQKLKQSQEAMSGYEEKLDQDRELIHSQRHQIEDLNKALSSSASELAEAQRKLDVKTPEGLLDLDDIIRSIVPNPKCTVSGCYGRRGWSGFSIKTVDGKRTIELSICCGKVGRTDATRILQAMNEHTFSILQRIDDVAASERIIPRIRRFFKRER